MNLSTNSRVERRLVNRIGHENKTSNTDLVRRSITSYLELILGCKNFEEDYIKLNQMESKIELKTFFKYTAITPDKLNDKLFEKLLEVYTSQEMLHIFLLCVGTKVKVELLYFSRCIESIRRKD